MHLRAVIASFVAVLLLSLGTPVRAAPVLLDIVEAPLSTRLDGSRFSLAEIQAAIIQACIAKGWTPQVAGQNQVNASILVRGRHYAEVTIPFDQDSYSILYADSRELDYKERTRGGELERRIHRNYNKWVQLLSQMIKVKLAEQITG